MRRPPPDIQYFLDCSFECGHIAGDVHHHFMHVSSDAARIIDGFEDGPQGYERHWHRLIDMGLYVEDRFLRERARTPLDLRRGCSYTGLLALRHQIAEFLGSYSSHLVDTGHTALTPAAVAEADRKFGFTTNVQVIRRGVHRAWADLDGLDAAQLRAVRDVEIDRIEDAAAVARQAILDAHPHLRDDELYDDEVGEAFARLQKERLARQKQERRVIKRSIKLAQKLLGHDTTRMFVGGGKIRFEGQFADYELVRTGSMTGHHGGSRLAVFDKGTDIHLCNVCIYTPSVPILDHVASIALHIRAGHEEDILKIGNPFNVSAQGRAHAWLQPFLPPPPKPSDGITLREIRIGDIPAPDWRCPVRAAKVARLRRTLHRYLYRIIEPAVPLIRTIHAVEQQVREPHRIVRPIPAIHID